MYSLVSPSVLCMDLVRHDNALGVLDVLDRAITLGPADIEALESAHRDDDARDRAWAEVERVCGDAPKLSDAVAAVRQTIADAGFDAVVETAASPTSCPVRRCSACPTCSRWSATMSSTGRGSAAATCRSCRHPAAAAVVVDAVAAAYVRDRLSIQTYARLGGPWAGLHFGVPTALPGNDEFGPQKPSAARARRVAGPAHRRGLPHHRADRGRCPYDRHRLVQADAQRDLGRLHVGPAAPPPPGPRSPRPGLYCWQGSPRCRRPPA